MSSAVPSWPSGPADTMSKPLGAAAEFRQHERRENAQDDEHQQELDEREPTCASATAGRVAQGARARIELRTVGEGVLFHRDYLMWSWREKMGITMPMKMVP